MSFDNELVYQKERLSLVREQLKKLLSTNVASYSQLGNSANYRTIVELREEENLIIRNIRKIEARISGQSTLFNGFVRVL